MMRCGVTHLVIRRHFHLDIDKLLETDLQQIVHEYLPGTLLDHLGMRVDDEGPASEPKLGCGTGILTSASRRTFLCARLLDCGVQTMFKPSRYSDMMCEISAKSSSDARSSLTIFSTSFFPISVEAKKLLQDETIFSICFGRNQKS